MSRTIHVVDDDAAVRASLTALLAACGLPSRGYASGDQFLADATPADADMIVMDLRMPGRTGIDVLVELRLANIRSQVVIITGHGGPEIIGRCHGKGVVGVLEKPFDPAELLALLGSA